MTKLNKRQRTFAEAYAIPGTECYGNATKSAIKAGYSEGSADVRGSKLLGNAKVSEYIKGVEQKLFDENIMSGKEVLYRLTRTARGETIEIDAQVVKTAEYIDNPNYKDEPKYNKRKTLVYNEKLELVEKPPKISDQNKALELLGKHHKLFTDVQDVTVEVPTFIDDIGSFEDE